MNKKEYRTIGKYKILTLSLVLVLSISVIGSAMYIKGLKMDISDLETDIIFLEMRGRVTFVREIDGTVALTWTYRGGIPEFRTTLYIDPDPSVPIRYENEIIKEE